MRRIRPSQCYSVTELARAIDRDVATVRRWLRRGLPTLDEQRPPLIDGAVAKKWLRERWRKRQRPSGDNQAYCFTCQAPRLFQQGTNAVRKQTAKVVVISGRCVVCAGKLNRFASAASVGIPTAEHGHQRHNNAA